MRGNSNDFPLQLEHTYEPAPEHVVGLREIIGVLRRDWRYPLFGCLIGLLLAVGYVLANPALYTSSARILVDRSLNRYLQTNKIIDQPTFDQAELESQIHILSSESIIVPVIRKLKLAEDAEFVGPPSAAGQQIVWSVSEFIKAAKKLVGWYNDAPVRTEAVLERIAVDAFLKRLSVYREDVANVITVSFQSEDPNKAAAIANEVADTYLATSADAKSKSTRMTSQWLQDRLTDLKVQAVEADRALQNYKIANNLVPEWQWLKPRRGSIAFSRQSAKESQAQP
jgi:succinoglycan biosynthesis transport protein ExoP